MEMKNKKITKLISETELNLKDIADQMTEEFLKVEENSVKRDINNFDDHRVDEEVEPTPEPDLIDYAVQNIMKGVFK
jgi:arginine repressor